MIVILKAIGSVFVIVFSIAVIISVVLFVRELVSLLTFNQ